MKVVNNMVIKEALEDIFGSTKDIEDISNKYGISKEVLLAAAKKNELCRCIGCNTWVYEYDVLYLDEQPMNDGRDLCDECRHKEGVKRNSYSITPFKKRVRNCISGNLWPEHELIYITSPMDDIGLFKIVKLSRQGSYPFLRAEICIDSTGKNITRGAVEITYYYPRSDRGGEHNKEKLEDVRKWLSEIENDNIFLGPLLGEFHGRMGCFLNISACVPFELRG